MAKNTSILLGDHFSNFINSEVASGRYSSASDVVRSALRLLEVEESRTKWLQNELEIGEKSGFVENYDPKKHLEEIKRKYL
ncbi:type II toxin-antitoxin system ParD family antitoxin [Flavobacterium sp. CYK-55]|jgi:antitoxin ParD1/3/4|uniref:type II toxin-antitoxin system ParD family antitoxin n=1 Tax=Flavobacterium sp. CYK-55 TaxID=2835529 RepID=UPI001BCE3C8B|nr:type II toxin-antitoxin system ParD family antitoxin [Flavobacterium sp. CYK-55]MBS7786178.1 type II toxin-antitoxin system ParD family antitoxin [Flavobacterium sp. CYK-55]